MQTLDDTVRETIHGILDDGLDVPLLRGMWKAAEKGNGQVSKNLSNAVIETMRNYHALWVYDGGGFVNPSLDRASIALTGNTHLATKLMLSLPLIVSKEMAMEAANEYMVSRSAMSGVIKTGVAEYLKSGAKDVASALKEVFWD